MRGVQSLTRCVRHFTRKPGWIPTRNAEPVQDSGRCSVGKSAPCALRNKIVEEAGVSGSRHQCLHFVRTRRRAGEICAQLLDRRGATKTLGNISNPLPPNPPLDCGNDIPHRRRVSITKNEAPRSNSRSCDFLKHGLAQVENAYRFGIESQPYLQMENGKKNVSLPLERGFA